MNTDYYYYQTLSFRNKRCYKLIYNGLVACESEISVPVMNWNKDECFRVYRAVLRDHPYLFYVDHRAERAEASGKEWKIHPHYFGTSAECAGWVKKVKQNAQSIVRKASLAKKPEIEKVRSIYHLLSEQVECTGLGNQRGLSDKEHLLSETPWGVFFERKAGSRGLACAFKLLLNEAGIRCILVDGSVRRGGHLSEHTWTIVRCANRYSHFDLAYSVYQNKTGKTDYDYFGLTDGAIRVDHSEYAGVPICSSKDTEYFEHYNRVIRTRGSLERFVRNNIKQIPGELYVRIDFDIPFEDAVKLARELVEQHIAGYGSKVDLKVYYRESRRTIRILIGAERSRSDE